MIDDAACLSSKDAAIPLAFSPVFVLKNHQTFNDEISSLITNKKSMIFFDQDPRGKKKVNRLVLLQALNVPYGHEDQCENCRRKNITLVDMTLNHLHEDQQISLWIVTQAQPTNLVDGTIYLIVRDKNNLHIRLGRSSSILSNQISLFQLFEIGLMSHRRMISKVERN